MPAVTPGYTLTASLFDLVGTAVPGATLIATLCNFFLAEPAVPATCVLSEIVKEFKPNGAGVVTAILWGNGQIVPAGTFYMIQIIDSKKNIVWAQNYLLTGSGGDLADITPYDPPPPIPSGNRVVEVVSVGGVAVFDAALGSAISTLFHITLTEDVLFPNATFINLIPGVPYQVVIEQDGTGNWKFEWPDNVGGPIFPVNPAGDGMTTQSFVGISLARSLDPGSMVATGPGIYFGGQTI